MTSFLLSLLFGPWMIPSSAAKIDRCSADSPQTHLAKQAPPPWAASDLTLVLTPWARMDNRFILLLLFTTVVLAFAGWLDDYTKLVKKNPKGASSAFKFTLQLFTALVVVGYLAANPPHAQYASSLSIPYTKELYLNLGFLYAALAMLVIIGSSNAVNLTDGLDGLAAGSIVFTALTFAILAYLPAM